MAGSVRLATLADAEAAGAVLGAGFEDDPVLSWVFPQQTRVKLTAMFTHLLRERFIPPGTTYLTDGAVAGWLPPEVHLGDGDGDDDAGARFVASMATATPEDWARLAQMGEATRESHPTEPHWYLAAIATLPDRRGEGLGSTLLAQALPAVDASGLPVYLESSNPRNISFYQRHGFGVVGRIDIAEGVSMTPMWRPPS